MGAVRGTGTCLGGAGCAGLPLDGMPSLEEMPALVAKAALGATGGGGVVMGLFRVAEAREIDGVRAAAGVLGGFPADRGRHEWAGWPMTMSELRQRSTTRSLARQASVMGPCTWCLNGGPGHAFRPARWGWPPSCGTLRGQLSGARWGLGRWRHQGCTAVAALTAVLRVPDAQPAARWPAWGR